MHSELSKVLAALLEVAKGNLEAQGSFTPFAMLLRTDSETLEYTAFQTARAVDDRTINSIRRWLTKEVESGAYQAVGYCALAEIDLQSPRRTVPAIFAGLEHSSGDAVEAYIPFEKADGYKYQRRIVNKCEPRIFGTTGH